MAKQDYAVELKGPIVEEIHHFVLRAIALGGKGASWFRRRLKVTGHGAMAPEGADEALFEAKLHPALLGRLTSAPDAERLRRAIVKVLRRAIERRGSSIRNYVGGSGRRGSR